MYLVSFRDFLRLLNCLLPEFKALPCMMEGFILEELLLTGFSRKRKQNKTSWCHRTSVEVIKNNSL